MDVFDPDKNQFPSPDPQVGWVPEFNGKYFCEQLGRVHSVIERSKYPPNDPNDESPSSKAFDICSGMNQ